MDILSLEFWYKNWCDSLAPWPNEYAYEHYTSQVKITIKIDNSRRKAVKKCLFTSYIKINNHKQQPLDNRVYKAPAAYTCTTVWSEAPRKLTIYYYCKCYEVNQTILELLRLSFSFLSQSLCVCVLIHWLIFFNFYTISTWNIFFFFCWLCKHAGAFFVEFFFW